MEQQAHNIDQSQSIRSKMTELILPGINKVWVRSGKGDWIEKSKMTASESKMKDPEDIDLTMTSKRWWQFWK